MSRSDLVAGIFVGGASSRMGSPKGLLPDASGVTLVERWIALFTELDVEHVLVGRRPEYAHVALVTLEDDPSGVGPIGGLAALLAYAGARRAIAVACDMPFVTRADLEALIATSGTAAARRDGWEPLCAIYDPSALPIVRARIAEGARSLTALLDALGAREVELPSAHLDDWDRPEDISRG